jgi:RHS repeat-associated protein
MQRQRLLGLVGGGVAMIRFSNRWWETTFAVLLSISLFLPSIAAAQTTVEYIHTDALGSPVAVTNSAGTVIERNNYEPYGAVIGNPTYQGVGYTGHVQDAATGLTYMQQRYYDPQVGLFLSVDPVTAYGSPVAMFNRYRYANNNPYRFKDPDGRKCVTTNGKESCTFDEFKDRKGKSITREQALSSGNRFTRALGIDRGSRILRAEAAMTEKYSDAKNLAARGGDVTIKGSQPLGIPDQKVSGSAIVSRMESTRTIANEGPSPTNAQAIASVGVTVTGAPVGEPINFWKDGAGASVKQTFGHEVLHTIYSGVGLPNRGWTNGDFNDEHQVPFDKASDAIR